MTCTRDPFRHNLAKGLHYPLDLHEVKDQTGPRRATFLLLPELGTCIPHSCHSVLLQCHL